VIKAAKILDARQGSYLNNAAIWIEGERIKEVGAAGDIVGHAPKNARVIDLGERTVLPGLIDCHTHLMSRMPGGPDSYTLTLATKSQAFRALEGAYNARLTLRAGFTTVRDVENEGSGYADVALRDAIEQGLAEGPRMQVATRAIASVGQYNPFGVSPDLRDFPTGAQMVSGVEESRRAVREGWRAAQKCSRPFPLPQAQAAKLIQPCESAFHHPAPLPQPAPCFVLPMASRCKI
jgi:imidazolonepropionase-like amidohydrolase